MWAKYGAIGEGWLEKWGREGIIDCFILVKVFNLGFLVDGDFSIIGSDL
jgi:hypothetical protein